MRPNRGERRLGGHGARRRRGVLPQRVGGVGLAQLLPVIATRARLLAQRHALAARSVLEHHAAHQPPASTLSPRRRRAAAAAAAATNAAKHAAAAANAAAAAAAARRRAVPSLRGCASAARLERVAGCRAAGAALERRLLSRRAA